ncbi:Hemin import ATP-binding protein HmuV [Corynebacterium ciconiae DSM 44920]|uniref:ABC transporter ATP-binding protein n=1 Tax=Corynebacterium ciconiae TaxID=227319 RepID=UPI0003683CA6|nr:ABC transporter ATP-binding protein [Corynebacterium ciconiae]WKD60508.1 Hemin import ATP-binding protein HmuV [Corynebacterium ciconiae DSM 44920]
MVTTLTLDSVEVRYGRSVIVPNFDCEPLRAGEFTSLLGPNAAGKSTLLKAIAGVNKHRGTVVLDTGDARFHGASLRRHVGYVPQDLPSSAALHAYETVLIAARRAQASSTSPEMAAAATMERLGIADLAHCYLGELSGGQRQLVAVAQALVTEPDVLVLDEPTSALDLHRQLFLLDLVQEWVREHNAIGLVAIHDINLAARYSDRLIVMKKGELHADGAPEKVLTPELIDSVYGVRAEVFERGGMRMVQPLSAV